MLQINCFKCLYGLLGLILFLFMSYVQAEPARLPKAGLRFFCYCGVKTCYVSDYGNEKVAKMQVTIQPRINS